MMSDGTSSEDDPSNAVVDTPDPDPDISLLGITTTISECNMLTTAMTKLFKAQSISAFFVKAISHKGAVLLTSINYQQISKAHHTRQATTIDKLQTNINKLKVDYSALYHCLTCSINLNSSYHKQLDSLTTDHASLKAKLQSSTTASFPISISLHALWRMSKPLTRNSNWRSICSPCLFQPLLL